MKQQFDNPNMMNPKKRNYFTGKKKLKNVKMFEEFLNEVTAEVSSPRKLRVPKEFEGKVMMAAKLATEIADLSEKVKQLQKLLDSSERSSGGIVDTMEKYGANAIKIGKIMVELEKSESHPRPSYQAIAKALEKLLPNMQDTINHLYEINTKPEVEKLKVKYSIEENLITDTWKSIKTWFTGKMHELKELLPSFEDSVKELEAAVAAK